MCKSATYYISLPCFVGGVTHRRMWWYKSWKPGSHAARKDMPYDLEKFTTCASALLADQLTNVVDIHYRHLEGIGAWWSCQGVAFRAKKPEWGWKSDDKPPDCGTDKMNCRKRRFWFWLFELWHYMNTIWTIWIMSYSVLDGYSQKIYDTIWTKKVDPAWSCFVLSEALKPNLGWRIMAWIRALNFPAHNSLSL